MNKHHYWASGPDARDLRSDPLPPLPKLHRQYRMKDRFIRFGAWTVLLLALATISFVATNALLDYTPSGFIQAKN